MANQFLQRAARKNARTENFAIAHSTTGNVFTDQFGIAGNYRGRQISSVFTDQAELHAVNPLGAIRFVFYLRLISRNYGDDGFNRGQGARDEAFKRLLWYLVTFPDIFYQNLDLLPLVGSYKDLWDLQTLALQNGLEIDEEYLYDLYRHAIESGDDLAKKYMPAIRSRSKIKSPRAAIRNNMAKRFARYLGLDYNEYRLLKASGNAHNWQQAISTGAYDRINFSRIPGHALHKLVRGKFLGNQGLERAYNVWLDRQPVAKFTGYVYELGDAVAKAYTSRSLTHARKATYDKQFLQLLTQATEGEGGLNENVWVALDVSPSMNGMVAGGTTSAYNVASSLAVFLASMIEGTFKNNIVMFGSRSHLKELRGGFSDMLTGIGRDRNHWGSTNFQSVIDLLVKTRRENPDIPLEDYPTTLLVVSDMQFDHIGDTETAHEANMRKLSGVFPQEYVQNFKTIWWQVRNDNRADGAFPKGNTYHSTIDDAGTYYISGFDGSSISLILGGSASQVVDKVTGETRQMNALELVEAALNQPVLQQVTV